MDYELGSYCCVYVQILFCVQPKKKKFIFKLCLPEKILFINKGTVKKWMYKYKNLDPKYVSGISTVLLF